MSTGTPTVHCLTQREWVALIVGMAMRMHTNRGDARYHPLFDGNHDGVIDLHDLLIVLRLPRCHGRHDR
jgi:hypothetical protein